jgi:hypothetical protein
MSPTIDRVLAFSLSAVVASCVPSSATRDDSGIGSSSATSASSDVKGAREPSPDQDVYANVFHQLVEENCAPEGFVVPCYFYEPGECRRAFDAQWPACAPDAAMPDSAAARWAAGEQMGGCVFRGAVGKRIPRVNDPVCKSRLPKQRIENPYLDANAGEPP